MKFRKFLYCIFFIELLAGIFSLSKLLNGFSQPAYIVYMYLFSIALIIFTGLVLYLIHDRTFKSASSPNYEINQYKYVPREYVNSFSNILYDIGVSHSDVLSDDILYQIQALLESVTKSKFSIEAYGKEFVFHNIKNKRELILTADSGYLLGHSSKNTSLYNFEPLESVEQMLNILFE